MKFNSEISKSIIDAVNETTKFSVDYETKQGCNEYLDKVINKATEAKGKIAELEESSIFNLEDIKDMLIAGQAKEIINIGDIIKFNLLTGEPASIICIGKNHDKLSGSKSKASLTFAFNECLDGEFEINKTCSNTGGWKECRMRNIYMSRIKMLLPEVIRNLIVVVEKYANNGDDELEKVDDELFLMSVREYTGTDEDSIDGEGEQYELFKNGYKFKDNKYWWTRSPYTSSNSHWNFVNSRGYISSNFVNTTYSVRPCFCIN